MKNFNKIISIIIVLFLLYSTSIVVSSFNYKNRYNNLDYITLKFEFSRPIIQKIEVNNEIYNRLIIDGLPNTGDLNKPCIPVKTVKILLPQGKELEKINIHTNDKILLKTDYKIEIGQNLLHIQNKPIEKFSIIESIDYSSNDIYSIVGIYKFRGFSILFLNIYPVEYNNFTGDVFYYDSVSINIKTKESSSATNVRGLKKDINSLMSRVDNPSYVFSYDETYLSENEEEVNYIIITSKTLASSNFDNNFNILAQSKIDKGISAKVITVEEILSNQNYSVNGTWGDNNINNPFYQDTITKNYEIFNDTQAKIRNFIRYAYMELGTDYILLGGDADFYNEKENIIPFRGLFANESGLPLKCSSFFIEEEDDIPSDLYYACLDGNFNYDMDIHFGECSERNNITNVDEADLIAEVYIGRACVDSEEEVSNFVKKTLEYERSNEELYHSKILMVGEYLGFPGVSAYGGNYKDDVIPLIPEDYNIGTLYDRDRSENWDKNNIIDIINNATPHIINHDGHSYYGYNMRMNNNDVDMLYNNKYFFAYSHGCMAGGFDNPDGYDCIAEHFTVETPYGAFAVIMNSRYGLGSNDNLNSPSQLFDKSFFKVIFSDNIRQLGRANHISKEENIGQIDENGIRWVYYETNLFGDPEISIKNSYNSNVDLKINITQPHTNSFYLFNQKICDIPFLSLSIIIGRMTIQTEVSSLQETDLISVDFLIDNFIKYVDYEPPYEWDVDILLLGKHTITAKVNGLYCEIGEKSLDIITLIPKRQIQ